MFPIARNRSRAPWTREPVLFDRVLEEFFGHPAEATGVSEFLPAFDVSETEKAWIVRAELPGIDPKDVTISAQEGVLTIQGEKKTETVAEGETVRRTERRYGAFVRRFELSSDVDMERVEARTKNGVLTVTLPKGEKARPKTIDIRAE